MVFSKSIFQLLVIVVLFVVFAGYSFMQADWTAPPTNPPTNNVAAPINVGASVTSFQPGKGSLQFDFLGARNTVQSNIEMRSPKYCDLDGINCIQPNNATLQRTQMKVAKEGYNAFAPSSFSGSSYASVPNTEYDFCFLTQQDFYMRGDNDESGTSCQVYNDGTNWVLKAYAGSRKAIMCVADCIKL